MKKQPVLITVFTFVVMVTASLTLAQPGDLVSQAYGKQSLAESKIISDTLTSHKLTCLSRDGVIKTVLLDGKWIEVREVELVNRTLVIRTDVGNISLAAVVKNP